MDPNMPKEDLKMQNFEAMAEAGEKHQEELLAAEEEEKKKELTEEDWKIIDQLLYDSYTQREYSLLGGRVEVTYRTMMEGEISDVIMPYVKKKAEEADKEERALTEIDINDLINKARLATNILILKMPKKDKVYDFSSMAMDEKIHMIKRMSSFIVEELLKKYNDFIFDIQEIIEAADIEKK